MAAVHGSWRGGAPCESAHSGAPGEFVRQGARLAALMERGRGREGSVDAELCAILDDLNAIDYYSKFLTESEVSGVVGQCCCLVRVDNSEVLVKFCLLLQNSLNRQKLVLVRSLDATLECLVTALRHFCQGQGSRALTSVLHALATVLYENVARSKRFHEVLVGSAGLLSRLSDRADLEPEQHRALLQCIESLTTRVGEGEYLGVAHQDQCSAALLRALHRPPLHSNDVLRAKMLVCALRAVQNVLVSSRTLPPHQVEPLLAAIHVYMVYGLPDAPTEVPSSLYSVPLSLYAPPDTKVNADDDPTSPRVNTDKISSSKTLSAAAKRSKKGRSKVGGQDRQETDGAGIPGNALHAGMDGLHARDWLGGDLSGEGRFPVAFFSSDSECSDTDGGAVGGQGGVSRAVASHRARVRLHSLACFHSLIKVVEKRVMFGYWSTFLPDTSDIGVMVPSRHTLFTVIMADPSHKARCVALSVLTALLEGSKQFLQAAEDGDQYRAAPFTPFSVTLGHTIKEIHRCLLLLLAADESAILLIQAIKCLSMLIGSVPYQRLRPGLLSRAVKQMRPYLTHRDVSIRVACLTLLGRVCGVQAPLLEVCHILQPPHRPSPRLSSTSDPRLDPPLPPPTEGGGQEAASTPPQNGVGSNLATPASTPAVQSGSATPAQMERLGGGGGGLSWVVKLCIRNVAPHLLAEPPRPTSEGRGESPRRAEAPDPSGGGGGVMQPLPVRLESLQVLATLTKGYFILVRPWLELMRELVQWGLGDTDPSIQLHAAKLLDVLSSMLLYQLQQQQQTFPCVAGQLSSIDITQAVDLWRPLLAGPLLPLLESISAESTTRSTLCDCLANVGPGAVFELLPVDVTGACVTLLMALARDKDYRVRAAALNALGCYIVYVCLRKEVSQVADIANVLLTAGSINSETNVTVRWKAAWALSNLTDALLLNRGDGLSEFIEDLSSLLLLKLCSTALALCADTDKVRCCAVRALGNLLFYLPPHCYNSGRFSAVVDSSIAAVTDNITVGSLKVRWNACYAVGNMFRNDVIQSSVTQRLPQIYGAVLAALQSSSHYKLRLSAVACLTCPPVRQCYGDARLFVSLWDALISVLTAPGDQSSEFTEYRQRVNLADQVLRALLHLACLVGGGADLNELHRPLHAHGGTLATELARFQRPEQELEQERAERSELVARAARRCSELRGEQEVDLTPHQCSTLDLLSSLLSLPTSQLDPLASLGEEEGDIASSNNPLLPSGFRQMYD